MAIGTGYGSLDAPGQFGARFLFGPTTQQAGWTDHRTIRRVMAQPIEPYRKKSPLLSVWVPVRRIIRSIVPLPSMSP